METEQQELFSCLLAFRRKEQQAKAAREKNAVCSFYAGGVEALEMLIEALQWESDFDKWNLEHGSI